MERKVPHQEWIPGELQDVKFEKKAKGAKGQVLVELQKSYKGDSRFKLDQKFDDLEVAKLPKHFKEMQQDLLKVNKEAEDDMQIEELPFQSEMNNQLNILSEIMPEHKIFIQHHKKPDKKQYNLIIEKFDPSKINKRLIVKKEPIPQKTQNKEKLKLSSGIDKKTLSIAKANKLLDRTAKQSTEIKATINKEAWKDIVTNGQKSTLFS